MRRVPREPVKTPSEGRELTFRRKIHYINPRFQGGIALVFSALVVAGGIAFGALVYRDLGKALWAAAKQGHYMMDSPYDIVREELLRHLAGLFVTVSCLGVAVFFYFIHATRRGIGRVIDVFRASGEGDLSTPTDARGMMEFSRFGSLADATRAEILRQVLAVREESEALAASGLAIDPFRLRWLELKRKIREIAP